MYCAKALFLLAISLPFLTAGAEITGLSHDKESGRTTVQWSGIDPKNGVVVYRSDRKLEGDELFFAEKYIFQSGSKQGIITARNSGKHYYRIAELTPYRKVAGKLSAEQTVMEFDRTPPPAISCKLEREGKKAALKLLAVPTEDVEKILLLTCEAPGKPVKTVAGAAAKSLQALALPDDLSQGYVALTAADRAGNYLMPSRWLYCGSRPDFSINGSALVSQNKDVRLSDRYMTVGKKSVLSFTVSNNGGASGNAVIAIKVTNKAGSVQELLQKSINIAAGEQEVVSVNYTPEKAGKVMLELVIKSANDVNTVNNVLKLPLYTTLKPFYVMWYGGNVMDLEYANYASVHENDREEFIRRGGKNLSTASRTTDKSGEDYYKRIKAAGAVGMQLDEIGGRLKATRFLPAIIDLESRHPELLSAVWHIGYSPQKEVIQALKERKIDLIMPEIYYKDGSPEEQQKALKSLRSRLEKLRQTGVAQYMLIGLGTHRNYLGWGGSPDKHAKFIEEQIKLVREVLPMSPGIAFYSSEADTSFLKQVDEMCRKYFLEQ